LSEDADVDDVIGVFPATCQYSSDIVYHLEPPVTVTHKDDSRQSVPDDVFRLESTSAGAVIYINKLDSAYNLQDARRFTFRLVAAVRGRQNATTSASTTVEVIDDDANGNLHSV